MRRGGPERRYTCDGVKKRDSLEPELSADTTVPVAVATFMACKRVTSGAELYPHQLRFLRPSLSQLDHLGNVRKVDLHNLLGRILESGNHRNLWFYSLR